MPSVYRLGLSEASLCYTCMGKCLPAAGEFCGILLACCQQSLVWPNPTGEYWSHMCFKHWETWRWLRTTICWVNDYLDSFMTVINNGAFQGISTLTFTAVCLVKLCSLLLQYHQSLSRCFASVLLWHVLFKNISSQSALFTSCTAYSCCHPGVHDHDGHLSHCCPRVHGWNNHLSGCIAR